MDNIIDDTKSYKIYLENVKPHKTYAVNIFNKKYLFTTSTITFGQTACMILPQHGDYNCPCNVCRTYKIVNLIEERHHVKLLSCDVDDSIPISEELQKTVNSSQNKFMIYLPSIN